MKKLLHGILEFREKVRPQVVEQYSQLARRQSPDTLLICCADSRVAPNVFASTNPGELLVVRNVGNLVPPAASRSDSSGEHAVGAAVEFALYELEVTDIVVCGHSECGAMQALASERRLSQAPHLESWLQGGKAALRKFREGFRLDPSLADHNQISQINVLEQIHHLRSYGSVVKKEKERKLRLHAWWFDIARAEILVIDEKLRRVDPLDAAQAQRVLDQIERGAAP